MSLNNDAVVSNGHGAPNAALLNNLTPVELLTQAEAAEEEVGLSAATISHYENGAYVSDGTRDQIVEWVQEAKKP